MPSPTLSLTSLIFLSARRRRPLLATYLATATLALMPLASSAKTALVSPSVTTDRLFSTKADTYIALAEQRNLAQSRGWLRLLYYPEPTQRPNAASSRITNPNFFVHKNGNHDPQAELSATITALFSQTQFNTSQSNAVRCRFPARTHWLMQQLGISANELPAINCPELITWERAFTPSAVSLVFVAEFLDNPASAFGHSFLRFDFPQATSTSQNASILNYMPKTLPGESFLKSSYKSVLVGNTGEFTIEPYEQKIASYRDEEGRDIWRYPLNLTLAQREQLARLIWEIKDQHLTYLLTKDNCASEILTLLNVLRPQQNYLAGYRSRVAPADIVRSLARQQVISGEPIYEPSKKSQHQIQLNQANSSFSQAPALSLVPANDNPLNAQALSRLSVGIGQLQHKNFTELGYRFVYHDALDGQTGYPVGFYLEGLSAKLRYFSQPFTQDNKLQLDNFTILKARSLHPINSANNGISWGGHLSIDRIIAPARDEQTSHLVGSIGAEYGWSIAYGQPPKNSAQLPPNICYALGTGDAQVGKGLANDTRVGVGILIGCIEQFSPTWRGLAEAKLPYWYEAGRNGSNGYWQPNVMVGVQHDFTRQDSLRLTGQYQWQPKPHILPNLIIKPDQRNTPELSLQYLRYF